MKKSIIAISAAALLLVAAACVPLAGAYFSDRSEANGAVVINIDTPDTDIEEEGEGLIKEIVIANNGTANCFVRVRLFIPESFNVKYEPQEGWSEDGDYWLYENILAPGDKSSMLKATVVLPDNYEQEAFDVVVVQELAPVEYNEDGSLKAPDWSKSVTSDYSYPGAEDA